MQHNSLSCYIVIIISSSSAHSFFRQKNVFFIFKLKLSQFRLKLGVHLRVHRFQKIQLGNRSYYASKINAKVAAVQFSKLVR
ncbi:unnamed protein product [Ixodes pacificus]